MLGESNMAKPSHPRSLVRAIVAHPWTSLQDGLLLCCVMIAAVLLAYQYNLFSFFDTLSDEQRRITLAEALFLTVLLIVCIFAFVLRRLYEERRGVAREVATKLRFRELRTQALRDSLTGLPNRRALLAALTAATESTDLANRKLVLFLIDLNGFKDVNDAHGHATGDRVLKSVAGRFRKVVRPSDLFARIGGDEFALLAYNVDRNTADAIGLRLMATLDRDIRLSGQSFKIGASVGAVLSPDDATTTAEILHKADMAMYRAKVKDEPSALVFFEPEADTSSRIAPAAKRRSLVAEPRSKT
jgi:diguanylate cyclase (GGDEF)-like protein